MESSGRDAFHGVDFFAAWQLHPTRWQLCFPVKSEMATQN